MDNLFACAGNYGETPLLIGGRQLKSMNRQFNKERARMLSCLTAGQGSSHSAKQSRRLDAIPWKREAVLRDYFYKTARLSVPEMQGSPCGCDRHRAQQGDQTGNRYGETEQPELHFHPPYAGGQDLEGSCCRIWKPIHPPGRELYFKSLLP
ncbi:MAG TPA: hypothetical protein IAA26_00885 [Candidatus Blautia faecipullorum]|nr:hypothetical protein [Candidatus Blautia faecipullorum]